MRKFYCGSGDACGDGWLGQRFQGGGGGRRSTMTPEQILATMMATRVDAIYKGVTITDAIKAKAVDILTKAWSMGVVESIALLRIAPTR